MRAMPRRTKAEGKAKKAMTPASSIARRSSLKAIAGAFAGLMLPSTAGARSVRALPFDQWIDEFRAKAIAHGITEETYTRVMRGVKPDTTGLEAIRNQPEFTEQLWQYLNRARRPTGASPPAGKRPTNTRRC